MAEEIEDEDTSLVDRAEHRADRFSDYKESRIEDAQRSHDAVHRIADNIPFGQPILVGHHSERHARKDAQRIENGMRKTVQMWQTARYWEQRAAGALHHAKYKALPGVRHRRIKGLEADKRKQERNKQEAEMWLKLWTDCANEQDKELQAKVALRIAGMCHLNMPRKEGDREDFQHSPSAYDALTGNHTSLYAPRTLDEVLAVALGTYPRIIPSYDRWIDHYTNRIAYEKAMFGESGGLAADRFSFELGGKVLVGDEWLVILKINKAGEAISSLTTTPRRHFYGSKYKADIESVKEYQAPQPDETAAVKAATKLPPMCNYPGDGFKHMTTDDWKRKKMSDVPQSATHPATDTHGAHRTRSTWGGNWKTVSVYLTDAKQIDPPTKVPLTPTEPTAADTLQTMTLDLKAQNPLPMLHTPRQRDERIPSHEELHELKKTATTGVTVVAIPQLFPTPPELADRMVALADIQPGQQVLEPSAGTGKIIDAIRRNAHGYAITAVELNCNLAHRLRTLGCVDDTHQADFLECNGNLGTFDRILMNPPFA
ncbi:DUF3560 domain-containing protein, partial [Edaphobacter aggregans]|uniref:DUF3560 domain-containing protein n=1 Tax=Edaphobacter aggregans TaxID=570835 RepID=UPI001470857E